MASGSLRGVLGVLIGLLCGVRADGQHLSGQGRAQAAGAVASAVGLGQPAILLGVHTSAAEKIDLSPWLIEDRRPVASRQENSSEYDAYNYVLIQAHQISSPVLARGARHDLTFAHLFEEPEKYRGEIVHVEGKLTRLRRFDPPPRAKAEGVAHLYEGWLFDTSAYGAHPMCLVFSELPPGMAVGDKVDYRVAFDGYFFKRYRYRAADRWRDTPLLIGHVPTLLQPPMTVAEEGLSHGTSLVMGFLGLLAGTFVLALGLAWWYQRGDRQIRARLDEARARLR
jgi:hypothetical protein